MRRAAALLLAVVALGADESARIAALVAELGNASFARREAAQAALVEIGEAALPALRAAVVATDAELAQRAGATLKEIESRILLARLVDPDLAARRRTLAHLVLSQKSSTVVATLELLAAPARGWALAEILYVETDVTLRAEVVQALLRMDGSEAQAGLAWALRDNLGHLQTVVETALAKAGRTAPAPIDDDAIRLAVGRGDSAERARAIRMVVTGLTTDARAIDAVGAILGDPDAELRRHATWAFRFLTPANHGPALIERAVRDPIREVRLEAILALTRLPENPVRTALLDVAGGPDPELARAAASALGDVGDAATEAALAALRERAEDVPLRRQIDQSLERIRARIADGR